MAPVAATACAVEAMHLSDGEHVLVTNADEAFADAVVRLYCDRAALGAAGSECAGEPGAALFAECSKETVREVFFAGGQALGA